jgi:hypothetical protein
LWRCCLRGACRECRGGSVGGGKRLVFEVVLFDGRVCLGAVVYGGLV